MAWEVEAALRKMKNEKAAGKYQFNIETLKAYTQLKHIITYYREAYFYMSVSCIIYIALTKQVLAEAVHHIDEVNIICIGDDTVTPVIDGK